MATELWGQSFGLKITVMPWAIFLISNGNNIAASNFALFAANDVNADKLPLETEPVAREC